MIRNSTFIVATFLLAIWGELAANTAHAGELLFETAHETVFTTDSVVNVALTVPDDAPAGTAYAVYDAVTGEVTFHLNGQKGLAFSSLGNMLAGGSAIGGAIDESGLPTSVFWANAAGWGDETQFAGAIVAPGTPIEEVFFSYSNDSLNFVLGDIILPSEGGPPEVPEPSTIVMMVLGMAGLWMMRRRRV